MSNTIEAFIIASVDTLISLHKGDYQKNVDNELLSSQFEDIFDYISKLEKPLQNIFPDTKDKFNLYNFDIPEDKNYGYYKITVLEYKDYVKWLVGVK